MLLHGRWSIGINRRVPTGKGRSSLLQQSGQCTQGQELADAFKCPPHGGGNVWGGERVTVGVPHFCFRRVGKKNNCCDCGDCHREKQSDEQCSSAWQPA